MALNIADIITDHARKRPDHPAIEDRDSILTYAEFDNRVSDTAARLRANGVGTGDIIAVALPDSAALLIVIFALARAGATILPVLLQLTQSERDKLISRHPVKGVITVEMYSNWGNVAKIDFGKICPREISDKSVAQSLERPDLPIDHPLIISASSGTTGEPRAFTLSHKQMEAVTTQCIESLGWNGNERYVALQGATDLWGCEDCIAILRLGATIIINRTQSHSEFIGLVNQFEVTAIVLSPPFLKGLLKQTRDTSCALPTVRTMTLGTAPVSNEERLLARKQLTPNFIEAYGTNEAPWLAVSQPEDQDRYPDSVGRILSSVDAMVVGKDHEPLPAGQVGLLRFRCDDTTISSYHDKELTDQIFQDGWFVPGDLGSINDEGYLFLKGRSDDMFINQGANVYPVEVEDILRSHPAVADAAVFGWPDEAKGEIPIAYVKTREPTTQKSISRHCAKLLAAYKLPETINFIDEMPRNSRGKVLKSKLRDLFRNSVKSG